MLESKVMNERQQAHIDYFLSRLDYWMSHRSHIRTCRMLAARDADEKCPLHKRAKFFARLLRATGARGVPMTEWGA